jgi:hypothetical protein
MRAAGKTTPAARCCSGAKSGRHSLGGGVTFPGIFLLYLSLSRSIISCSSDEVELFPSSQPPFPTLVMFAFDFDFDRVSKSRMQSWARRTSMRVILPSAEDGRNEGKEDKKEKVSRGRMSPKVAVNGSLFFPSRRHLPSVSVFFAELGGSV